jgi:hypothetical protein
MQYNTSTFPENVSPKVGNPRKIALGEEHFAMKKLKYTEEQIASALKQAETSTSSWTFHVLEGLQIPPLLSHSSRSSGMNAYM